MDSEVIPDRYCLLHGCHPRSAGPGGGHFGPDEGESDIGHCRNWASPRTATSWPMVMSPAVAWVPANQASAARKIPDNAALTPM